MPIATPISILASNQTALIMDVNYLRANKEDSTLFSIIATEFFEYPNCYGTGYSNFSAFAKDTILMKTQFHVKQGTATNQITLQNISANIIATKQNDVEEFPLETFSINTAGFLPNCDNIQEIEFSQERDFILPTGDCRNEIQLFRMPTLDIVGYSAYEFIYPFKIRWEEWRQLSGANRCFSNPTQNWTVYANATGWSIKFSIKATVNKQNIVDNCLVNNPISTDFESITWCTIKDPCDIPYTVEFNTYDSTGLNSYEEVIARDANTLVVATVTGDFSGYSQSQLYGILSLDAPNVGGVAYSQEIGDRIDVDSDFVWSGFNTPLRLDLTKVSNNQVTLTAVLNYLYLPKDTGKFILSARIGEYHQSVSSSGSVGCLNEVTAFVFECGELEIIAALDSNTLIVTGIVTTPDERNMIVENMEIEFLTATTWKINQGGTIGGNPILTGSVGGNVIKAPAHPYSTSNVGDTIQGYLTGTIYSSQTQINGIGEMQIGCTFFVS